MAKIEMKSVLYLPQLLTIFFTTFCFGQDLNCTTGDLRLYNSSAPGLGMLQQCNSTNQWEAVCNSYWECADAKVACRQLGFNDSSPNTFPDGYFGKWDSMPNTYYGCSGSEQSLQDCSTAPHSYCNIANYPDRMAGLACHSPLGECIHGDLRLVGGESESEGRVEVCYKGGWYSVCGSEDEEASVMCKQLGHTEYPWAAVFSDGRFGKTPLSQGYIEFECSDQFSEDRWTDCSVTTPSCTKCNGDAIKCFTPSECDEGSLRLADGIIDNEGRVEVCLQGVWGTVCSISGWQQIDGYVACKQINLGASGKAPTVYSSASDFGDGKQPMVMYSPACNGWENALTDCSYNAYGSLFYSRTYTAGILCFDDCNDGEVRLVGGASDSEGTVEVCLGNLWGLVAESGWNLADAQVVCNQLGFPLDDVQAVNKSLYGKPRRPIHFSNVHCTGEEQQLLDCDHFIFPTLEDKKDIFSHVDVAGILCRPQTQNQTSSSASSESCDLSSAVSLLVPAYLTMLFVMVGFALGFLALVMYCKKKPIQGTNTANTNNQKILVKSEQGTLTPRYEMSNKKACLPTPFAPTALQTTAMEIETDETEPVYEITEPIDYDEMS